MATNRPDRREPTVTHNPKRTKHNRSPLTDYSNSIKKMKKGIHPQMQWISYVTQNGQLMQVMMTRIHMAGKVYHLKGKRQRAEAEGQVAKFNRRYGVKEEEKHSENADSK